MTLAFMIGIAFGFVLERGGLGSARKLASQFYLTDMTVFKVMFTAIVTAMVGLYILTKTGVISASSLHVTPTYVLPQAVGGLIFGVGFILGGYCPGTCCVSASTGRRDSVLFLVGMVLGIVLFGEILFPLVSDFYYSTPLGQITLQSLFHLPEGALVLSVLLMAGCGFVVAERLEKKFAASANDQKVSAFQHESTNPITNVLR